MIRPRLVNKGMFMAKAHVFLVVYTVLIRVEANAIYNNYVFILPKYLTQNFDSGSAEIVILNMQ